MFGIDDALALSLLGGAIGGLTNQKNPLMGAAMGAGAGYLGAGLLPASGAAGGAAGGMTVPFPATQSFNPSTLSLVEGATPMPMITQPMPGVGGLGLPSMPPPTFMDKVKELGGMVKPIGQAAQAAQTANGLLGGGEHPPPVIAPPPPPPMPNNTLGNMVQGMQQRNMAQMQQDAQMRALRRRGLLRGM